MSESFKLNAVARQDVGKGASRRLRRAGLQVPAILYGAGGDSLSITLQTNEVSKALSNRAFYSSIIDLNLDGNVEPVVVKDIQRDPTKPKVFHMDFQRVDMKKVLHMHVPLNFIGEEESPGVKEGGVVTHTLTQVEVTCLAKDLPTGIDVDISKLEMDQVLHLSDLKVGKGVELRELALGEEHDQPVVSVHVPAVVAEPEVAEGEEGADGEAAEGEAADGGESAEGGDADAKGDDADAKDDK